ncbi:M20/M25/M40 family metallo-hydrolase [Candidatus Woesearchaeota archaeon]|jgi:succinyl-diaminopimelate desuccinylase|nr:M20/M25/M40 family metallo-hydrolase [Candidatus Woesearchaeota archaeon]MBT3538409.1 M20/M25/M40 family metallo-hydrolase [Candidatus Woesearchaeota archaeon]MBT4696859.1 M20/M25/M40 family metallo-hydrolase [Candidatus Woesearchaeota archaeon]MBT7106135.1 M20/M25/M40 family metallo-hydrolase [Candidatus Woesearchaeota archaeon]MBT7930967.1 M20/M25/M40 family metallo-hydrolase [Candidatus Woesearchaeota archaeon]
MSINFEELARARADDIVDLTQRLVAIRTVNYDTTNFPNGGPDGMESPGEESKVAEVIADEFRAMGIEPQFFGEHPRQDVVGVIGRQEPGYRKLLLPTHSDTVPSGEEAWTEMADPFKPVVKDGYIFGRGSFDNKGPMAATIAMARMLKQYEDQIPGAIIFAAVHDEEVGMSAGLTELVKSGSIDATDAIIPDVGEEMARVIIAEKEIMMLDVIAKGKEAHGSTPQNGINAVVALAGYMAALDNYVLRHEADPRFSDGPTINVGMLNGGSAPNTVPGSAKASLDMRYLPGRTRRQVLRELRNLRRTYEKGGATFRPVVKMHMESHSVDPDDDLVKAIVQYSGADAIGIGGRTVCGALAKAGLTAVGWGPGEDKYFHVADERIAVQQLVDFAAKGSEIAMYVAQQRVH